MEGVTFIMVVFAATAVITVAGILLGIWAAVALILSVIGKRADKAQGKVVELTQDTQNGS